MKQTPSAALLALSAVALGYAIQLDSGFFSPRAILWLTVALLFCLLGIISPFGLAERIKRPVLILILLSGLAFQFWHLLNASPGMYLRHITLQRRGLFSAGLFTVTALIGLGLIDARRVRRLWFPLILVVHFLLGIWVIRASPNPWIDVFVVHRIAIDALFHGENPYAISFPDIYGMGEDYPAGLAAGGRVYFGLPYPPLSLMLAAVGEAVANDFRYAALAALTLSGLFMTYATRNGVGWLAACLFMFTPRVFFVLEQGWTEPFVVMLLSMTIFCVARRPRLLPVAAGLLFAVKQYLLLLAPLIFLLTPVTRYARDRRWLLLTVGLVAAAVTLPMALWDVSAFLKSVVLVQIRERLRVDSLSYLGLLASQGIQPPLWLWVVPVTAVLVLICVRVSRTPAGLAGAISLLMLVFFAFGKKAFCNYHFFVIGALCSAVAMTEFRGTPRTTEHESQSSP